MSKIPVDEYIDDSGIPSLRIFKFVSALIGIPVFAWFSGLIGSLSALFGGFDSARDTVIDWILDDVIGGLFGILVDPWVVAYRNNIRFFTANFGLLAWPIMVVEIAILVYLFIVLFSNLAGGIGG